MFPHIHHIDEVLPFIAGRQDFAVKRSAGYTAIDYIFAGDGTFDEPIRRELRGIKFDADGKILARPYHKFFNLGEKPETQPEAVDWEAAHIVLEKLDGSMVHPAEVGGEILWMTRAGVTDISRDAGAFAAQAGYVDECHELLRAGITPIFEWCSPRNQIVLLYPEDTLILTGMRETVTGRYLHPHRRVKSAPLVQAWDHTVRDVAAFHVHVKAMEDAEGYVVRFMSGFMVKVKADAYVTRHRARDSTTLEKNVLRIVMEDADDDVMALLPPVEAERLRQFAIAVRTGVSGTTETLAECVGAARTALADDRKRFALEVVPTLPDLLRGPAFGIWTGRDPRAVVSEIVLKHCGSSTDVERVRGIIGGAKWAPGAPLEG